MKGPLDKYRSSIHSAHGEDGIIRALVEKLGIEQDWCCEFGAHDGTFCSNTLALVERGWHGLFIEPDIEHRKSLMSLARKWPNLDIEFAFVANGSCSCSYAEQRYDGAHKSEIPTKSLDDLLTCHNFPPDFAVLNIDIDGGDAVAWSSLSKFRPRIVIIEINSGRVDYLECMAELGERKKYTLLGHCGNVVFVRDEDVSELDLGIMPSWKELFTPDEKDW